MIIIINTGCEDQSAIGVNLLDGESIDVIYSDTFSLKAKTILRDDDQLPTYRVGSSVGTLLIGNLDDPIFGKSSSQCYMETGIKGVTSLPDYSEGVFDSMVLILALDTLGTYGEVASHDIEVYAIEENISELDTVYSDQTFSIGMSPIGVRQNVHINAKDSTIITNHGDDTQVTNPPQLRVRLDDAFGTMIFEDTTAVKSDTAFMDVLQGLHVRSTSDNNSMFGVDLSTTATGSFASTMVMYYTVEDTIKSTFTYSLSGVRFSTFSNDQMGSEVDASIDDQEKGKEELYIQSMLGPNIEFDISSVKSLSSKLLNKVELEIYEKIQSPEDQLLYPPINDLIASNRGDDDDLQIVQDIQLALLQGGDSNVNRTVIFGGDIEEVEIDGVTLNKYTMNITSHVQYLNNNPDESHLLILTPLSRIALPNRSVIYGTEDSQYSSKLKVTYTEP